MDASEKGSCTNKVWWAVIPVVLILGIVAVFIGPKVVAHVRSATALNPKNFENANTEFFERLSSHEITIISPSTSQPHEVKQGQFKIAMEPMRLDPKHAADQKNWKAHANDAVLVFACYELLNGEKKLGMKLLELLKQHDNEIRYNYPTGKKGLLGDTGANIHIDEFLRASEKFMKGDESERDVLEKPASQYEWRKKEYAPEKINKQGQA